jgi:hypothetical protein
VTTSAAEFMKAAPRPLNSNSAWGSRYAAELRRVVHTAAEQAPRSLQAHLGPSEIGHACDRRIAAKLAGLPRTNHVQDPWPSIIGTAVHAWLADAFASENDRIGRIRWAPEARVTPIDGHPGTADLYDADEFTVVDHKVLGESSMAKIRSPNGPPRHYLIQLLAYARGYRRLGLPVRRVAIAAYPRTLATLDGLFIWERPYTSADDALLDQVVAQLAVRKQWAAALITGSAQLTDIPADIEDCHFCEQFRPQSARDGGPGCPGNASTSTNPYLL